MGNFFSSKSTSLRNHFPNSLPSPHICGQFCSGFNCACSLEIGKRNDFLIIILHILFKDQFQFGTVLKQTVIRFSVYEKKKKKMIMFVKMNRKQLNYIIKYIMHRSHALTLRFHLTVLWSFCLPLSLIHRRRRFVGFINYIDINIQYIGNEHKTKMNKNKFLWISCVAV